ncbi:hypothetical protein GCG21_13695 [Pseudactinotalea sp. HY160]|nr:hypothetical protein [Pseudactinotalea sp. HY160]
MADFAAPALRPEGCGLGFGLGAGAGLGFGAGLFGFGFGWEEEDEELLDDEDDWFEVPVDAGEEGPDEDCPDVEELPAAA